MFQLSGDGQGIFFFVVAPFCSCPASLVSRKFFGRRHGARAKITNTLGGVFLFALAPCRRPTGLRLPLPFAVAATKKTPWVVFFFLLWPRAGTGLLLSLPFPGPEQKKTPWVVFFFCCGLARRLTHSRRAWVAMPPPRRGGVFLFFFAAAPPGPG